jgi:hypothetical protein
MKGFKPLKALQNKQGVQIMLLHKSVRQAGLSAITVLMLLAGTSSFAPTFASHRHGGHDHRGHSSVKKVCYHRYDGVRCFYVRSR